MNDLGRWREVTQGNPNYAVDEPKPRRWEPLQEIPAPPGGAGGTYYENRYYSVVVRAVPEQLGILQILIHNADQSARQDWREFQQIKNEVVGEDCEAVQLYPAEDRKLDPSNAFILYAFPGKRLPFGEEVRIVLPPHESPGPQRRFILDKKQGKRGHLKRKKNATR